MQKFRGHHESGYSSILLKLDVIESITFPPKHLYLQKHLNFFYIPYYHYQFKMSWWIVYFGRLRIGRLRMSGLRNKQLKININKANFMFKIKVREIIEKWKPLHWSAYFAVLQVISDNGFNWFLWIVLKRKFERFCIPYSEKDFDEVSVEILSLKTLPKIKEVVVS